MIIQEQLHRKIQWWAEFLQRFPVLSLIICDAFFLWRWPFLGEAKRPLVNCMPGQCFANTFVVYAHVPTLYSAFWCWNSIMCCLVSQAGLRIHLCIATDCSEEGCPFRTLPAFPKFLGTSDLLSIWTHLTSRGCPDQLSLSAGSVPCSSQDPLSGLLQPIPQHHTHSHHGFCFWAADPHHLDGPTSPSVCDSQT